MIHRRSIWLSCLLLASPLCQGQTNLFKGFKKNNKEGLIDDVPTAKLSNNQKIPLVGLGVGNLQVNLVEDMIYQGLKADHKIRLIDTAHASYNEDKVAKGIVAGVQRFKDSEKLEGKVQVHVVTKIWYTHLGSGRTKLSVHESLEAFKPAIMDENVDLKVHFLIHWPRCYEGIPWMKCEEEERALPQKVKDAGPPPQDDKDNAWKQTWKALEDIYNSNDYPVIAGIGVSNFSGDDLDELMNIAKVKPHIMQMNVWSLLNDPHLVDLCNKNDVHMQVFNVMNGIVNRAFVAPHAHHHMLMVANDITKNELPADALAVSGSQVVLKWLIQFGISIIPRTTNLDRLSENSAVSLARIPDLTEDHMEIVAHAMEALLSGNDMEEDAHVKVTFHAKNQDMFLYWFHGAEKEKQISYIGIGEAFEEKTHPKHTFRVYNAYDPDIYHDHTVQGNYGDHEHVHVEL
jgi:D-xylose reductase